MAILMLSESIGKFDFWVDKLKALDSSLDLREWHNHGDLNEITTVLAWNPKDEYFAQLPNLKLVQNLGMGVDALLKCKNIPENVTIARVIDHDMKYQMAEYVLYGAIKAYKNIQLYNKHQPSNLWKPEKRRFKEDITVGVLGYGELGRYVANEIKQFGFNTIAWKNRRTENKELTCFFGKEELPDFLKETDILVCLLPLTPDTENIINKEHLSLLKQGAYLINVARGKHVVDEALVELIKTKHISGALLDVFRTEPLPQDHPFWQIPQIEITPHIAALTNPETAAKQIVENIHRIKSGKQPLNTVNIQRGY